MKELLAFVVFALAAFAPFAVASEILEFQCVWDERDKVKITLDTSEGTGVRDDGGASYRVMHITKDAVFVQVEKPGWYLVAVQVIERPSGGWHDAIVYDDGRASAVEGGRCIEIGDGKPDQGANDQK